MQIVQQNKTIFGQALSGHPQMGVKERIATTKQLYQKEAMRIVSTADRAEKSIDGIIEERKGRIRELLADNENAGKMYGGYKGRMDRAKAEYGIEDGSREEEDLKLLQKEFDSKKPGGAVLTEDEKKRLSEMGEMTEYQKQAMELYEQADYWKSRMEKNQLAIRAESSTIRSIGIERLKQHGMIDANLAKEDILKAASDEAIDIMREEAKNQIDEKAEEVREEAAKRAEKKEEQQERIEAAKEKQEEAKDAAGEVRENIDGMTEQMQNGEKLEKEVEEEVKKLKLLEEDLKGLAVNSWV